MTFCFGGRFHWSQYFFSGIKYSLALAVEVEHDLFPLDNLKDSQKKAKKLAHTETIFQRVVKFC